MITHEPEINDMAYRLNLELIEQDHFEQIKNFCSLKNWFMKHMTKGNSEKNCS